MNIMGKFFVTLFLLAVVNLSLHYSVHDDHQPGELQSVSDCQYCQIFDSSLVDQLTDICLAMSACSLELYFELNPYSQIYILFQARAPPIQLLV